MNANATEEKNAAVFDTGKSSSGCGRSIERWTRFLAFLEIVWERIVKDAATADAEQRSFTVLFVDSIAVYDIFGLHNYHPVAKLHERRCNRDNDASANCFFGTIGTIKVIFVFDRWSQQLKNYMEQQSYAKALPSFETRLRSIFPFNTIRFEYDFKWTVDEATKGVLLRSHRTELLNRVGILYKVWRFGESTTKWQPIINVPMQMISGM